MELPVQDPLGHDTRHAEADLVERRLEQRGLEGLGQIERGYPAAGRVVEGREPGVDRSGPAEDDR